MRTLLVNLSLFLDRFFSAIAAVAVLVVLIIGWTIVLEPQVSSLRERGIFELRLQQNLLQERQEELNRLNAFKERLQVLPNDYSEKLTRVVPAAIDSTEIFFELEQIAAASGVRLVSSEVDDTKTQKETVLQRYSSQTEIGPARPDKKNISVNFTVAGLSYDRLKIFLKNLEQSVHLYDVLALVYTPQTNIYTFTAQTYLSSQ